VFILNFHGIGAPRHELPPTERRVWIDRVQFEALLDYAKPRPDVELTFDDSNESDYSIALPALQQRGMHAQFFVVAERVGRPGYLSRAQVTALLAAGMKIGSHGLRHRPWAGLDDGGLQEELVVARDRLEQWTGIKIDKAACPFGSYNRRVIQTLRGARYKCIYTSDGGPAQAGALVLPRNTVYNAWTLETVKQVLSDEVAPLHRLARNLKLAFKRWR
jgi:peptidoglycan/xylan/chitin deacetylase (PgdA/CDA1 family)